MTAANMSITTKNADELKKAVKEKYTEISQQSAEHNGRSCCGAGGRSGEVYNIMTDDCGSVEGYRAEADLALGCGLPTQFAQVKAGERVSGLGCGAGND